MTTDNYRAGVGLMILNQDNMVFMGERINSSGEFQMPQGGIDAGEDLEKAVFRELYEETGIQNAEICAEIDDWMYYDFPESWRKRLFQGRYKGQRQKWFLLRFLGDEGEINLMADDIQEFVSYQWAEPQTIPDMAINFKRKTYLQVLDGFAAYLL